MISAIVPTYNEEHTIGSLLENLKELRAEEVIVADGILLTGRSKLHRPTPTSSAAKPAAPCK
jgi:hypothetical protein